MTDPLWITEIERGCKLNETIAALQSLTGSIPADVTTTQVRQLIAHARKLSATLEFLKGVLPDSIHKGRDCWDWCWNELDGDAQDEVHAARVVANAVLASTEPPKIGDAKS